MRPRCATMALAVPALAVLAVMAIGPIVAPHGAAETLEAPFTRSSNSWPLGTDHLGRDVWSRLLHGGRAIIGLPLLATLMASLIGGVLGVAACASPRRTGALVMRSLDVVVVLPPVLVLLVLLNRSPGRSWVLVVAVVVVTTPFAARYAQSAATPILASGYVEQALATGEGRAAVLRREVVPNLAGPLLADTGLRFVGAIHLAAAAGFLGFGPAPPATDWGSMIAENIDGAGLNPWAIVAPCLAIALLTVPTNLLADRFAQRVAR